MFDSRKVAVVVPAYRVQDQIAEVIRSLPGFVDIILVIDDHCPNGSGLAAQQVSDPRLKVLFHSENRGVGGAMKSGFTEALRLGVDFIVKVDGDGQMDPNRISSLIEAVTDGNADFAKGNRFVNFSALSSMPFWRLFGNSTLSFLVKAMSGYWNVMDPTNGFFAITRKALEKIRMKDLDDRYYFEISLLQNLSIINARVVDLYMPAQYGDEKSSLRLENVLWQFPGKLFKSFLKRIFLKYFIYDFNMGSVYFLLGVPSMLFSFVFGSFLWWDSNRTQKPKPVGAVMLFALPLILGFQMILQGIETDIRLNPSTRK